MEHRRYVCLARWASERRRRVAEPEPDAAPPVHLLIAADEDEPVLEGSLDHEEATLPSAA